MSKIEELIEKLCPNGVEWKELGKVCEILDNKRKPITKKDRIMGEYPYYGANGIPDYVVDYIFDGTFLLVGEDGSVLRNDNSPFLNWAVGKIWVNNHAHVLSEKRGTLLRYLYFVLQTINIAHLIKGTSPKLNQQNLRSIKIPIPPLEIQEEIVHILDSFTELTARRKQYEFYRDSLLTFGDEVERVKLKDIADIGTGRGNTNEGLDVGEYPFFVRSQEILYKNTYEYDETAIITSGDGVGVGKIFHYIDGKYALHQRAYRIHINIETVIPKYYFYYMKTMFLDYIKKTAVNSSVTSIRRYMLDNFLVPIPPLQEQKRIVSILDKFDKLCNGISEGLPAEIEARKKQYEYYRDKLLNFEELQKS